MAAMSSAFVATRPTLIGSPLMPNLVRVIRGASSNGVVLTTMGSAAWALAAASNTTTKKRRVNFNEDGNMLRQLLRGQGRLQLLTLTKTAPF